MKVSNMRNGERTMRLRIGESVHFIKNGREYYMQRKQNWYGQHQFLYVAYDIENGRKIGRPWIIGTERKNKLLKGAEILRTWKGSF